MQVPTLDSFPASRAQILRAIKRDGGCTLSELAQELDVTTENVRQLLQELIAGGWVRKDDMRRPTGPGRPAVTYALTTAGDHLFPKSYDALSLKLIETLAAKYGSDALKGAMEALTDANVREWQGKLRGKKTLRDKLAALKGIYLADDPYTQTRITGSEYRLIEKNCPYLNVALHKPQMCSITLSTLSRLLGYRVVREKRFQDGDNRCVFRVLTDQPVDPKTFGFRLEEGQSLD